MLVLMRRPGEELELWRSGELIGRVKVLKVTERLRFPPGKGRPQVTIGIEAPKDVDILRTDAVSKTRREGVYDGE